jgi:preprotein translocase subunit SecA
VPFTDGVRQLQINVPLQEMVDSDGKILTHHLHKSITLSIIDNAWKEHLREMDDLKQRVQQSASLEQKDPLLIYKVAAFEEFTKMIGELNKEISSFIFKSDIPQQDPNQVRAARPRMARPAPKLRESREDLQAAMDQVANKDTRDDVKQNPIKSDKVYGRNDKVKVQYQDGRVVENAKYKSVEQDVLNGVAQIVEV